MIYGLVLGMWIYVQYHHHQATLLHIYLSCTTRIKNMFKRDSFTSWSWAWYGLDRFFLPIYIFCYKTGCTVIWLYCTSLRYFIQSTIFILFRVLSFFFKFHHLRFQFFWLLIEIRDSGESRLFANNGEGYMGYDNPLATTLVVF